MTKYEREKKKRPIKDTLPRKTSAPKKKHALLMCHVVLEVM